MLMLTPSEAPAPGESISLSKNGEPGSAGWVAAALEAALQARAPGVHASTPMVRQLAVKVGRELGLDAQTEDLLDVSIRTRDVGMIALPDSVVLATTALTPGGWELVNRHPVIGAQLLEKLFVAASAAQVVRAHHERWDGEGYPDGLAGENIPLLSRVIATCDAFVAIASDRPHRRGIGAEAALAHIARERGSQLDPHIVDTLAAALAGNSTRKSPTRRTIARDMGSRRGPRIESARVRGRALTSRIAEFDLVPAFAPAHERVLSLTATSTNSASDLVAAIESDIGLTVAVLRAAQTVAGRHSIANVPDALAALRPSGIEGAIKHLPRAEFPWRTSPLEVLLHRSRVHAQAVMRAAERIARELELPERDDLLAAALLHDVGKLVIGRARPDYSNTIDAQTTTPEERVRQERRSIGMDHASLSALLMSRWGLPGQLIGTIAAHHSSENHSDIATHVRLADMIAHHTQGDAIDRRKMLRLARTCGLSPGALRDALFDLPHSGGSRRRRAEPSPLSNGQTRVIRILAQGKLYKVIAQELGVSTSTVRSHLHNAYAKLGVDDRAQAVLRVTEMGWI